MKIIGSLATALFLVLPAHAGFENWTNKEGKSATLELLQVQGDDDAKEGVFRMRNGQKVIIKMENLSEADAERLSTWKPTLPGVPQALSQPSVFDDILKGNLLAVDGKKLKKTEIKTSPTEYYVFYYTASWCGPCQMFTPSLVEFYNKNKNDKFEIVVITSDRDEGAMEKYAVGKKMPWPLLKQSKAASFKGKFNHGVNGIPSVIVCDLEGKIVSRDGRNLNELKKLVK